ncbi:hypothetical protein Leryth_022744 [Lithospermum erythrorhizon]|nr:hypothetical protein Leryth_022744 [Lithospermum erythrorhizon]
MRKFGSSYSPKCDLFSGKWVFDNTSTYPLYRDYECKFMFDDLACEKYGRKDLDYQRWRWQPHDCDLPRFNATKMLERLRNKRLVLVGDSVNRNQWVSLMCMLEGSIPAPFKSMKLMGSLYTFKATEYNASIDYYWAPLMVESAADDPSSHHTNGRVIRVNSIEKHAIHWGNADVLIFNSYLWWQVSEVELVWGSLDKPRKVKKVDNRYSYKMALKTWSKWITTHLKYSNTKLFFMSMPATHMRADDWGKQKYHSCLNETQPITKNDYWGSGSDPKMFHILEDEIKNLMIQGINIQFLNITQLSEYRKDGHPTIYRKQWRPLTKKQIANPLLYADCTHWCLPGVPDVWNQILYAHLV